MAQNSSLKYSGAYHQTHERDNRYVVGSKILLGGHQIGNPSNTKSDKATKHKRFFRHPRIQVDKHLDKTPITIQVDGIKKSDDTRPEPEEFKAYIWSFKVYNKNYFSAPADRCSAQIKITNVNQYLNFTWRSNIPILEKCHIGELTDEPPRQIYAKLLAYQYLIEHFIDTNDPSVDIQKQNDEPYLLNFMFTFEDSEYAYFISPIEMAKWYGEHDVFYSAVGGTHLLIPMGTRDFPVTIKFQWLKPGSIDQYEYSSVSGERYLINANSWDNISMSRS